MCFPPLHHRRFEGLSQLSSSCPPPYSPPSPLPAPRFRRSIRFRFERVAQLIASLKKPLQFRLWVSPYIINPKDLVSTDNPRVLNPGGEGDTASARGHGYAPCHGVTRGGMIKPFLGGGVGNARKRYSVCVVAWGKYAAQTTPVPVPPFGCFRRFPRLIVLLPNICWDEAVDYIRTTARIIFQDCACF